MPHEVSLATRLRARLLPGSALPALVVTLVVTAVGALYVLAFATALGDPQPRDVPVAVVGVAPQRVEQPFGGAIAARAYPDAASARHALTEQSVYGVVVASGGGLELDVASAAGPSVSRVLEQGAPELQRGLGEPVTVRDLHPISERDPSGTVFFYVVLAAVITGFIGTVQTRVNAPALGMRGQLGWDAGRAAGIGLVIAALIGPLGHFEEVPFWPTAIVLAATNWAASTTYSLLRILVGARWSLLPTWILFILVSTPSSGGAVSAPLLPPLLATVGAYLPTGAAITLLRDVTYFVDALHPTPFVVVVVWSIVPAVLFGLLGRRQERSRRAQAPAPAPVSAVAARAARPPR